MDKEDRLGKEARLIKEVSLNSEDKIIKSEKEKTNKLLYDCYFIGLTTDRETLYNRINKRVDVMIENGLIEEAKKIYETGKRTKAVMTVIRAIDDLKKAGLVETKQRFRSHGEKSSLQYHLKI